MGSTSKLFEFILEQYGIWGELIAKERWTILVTFMIFVYICICTVQHITSSGSPMSDLDLQDRY